MPAAQSASLSYYSYEWEWRTQTTLPPPAKTFGSNNGAWAGSKSLYLSSTNQASADVSSTIRQMKPNDTIKIEHKTDPTIWANFVLSVIPVEYTNSFTFPSSLSGSQGAPVNNTVYKVTLSTGAAQPAPGALVFCLLEDGALAKYNDMSGAWAYATMPADMCKGYARVISDARMPNGFELIHNVYTQLWSWRKVGSAKVPPPAIDGEVGGVFHAEIEAIEDIKQRHQMKDFTQ